MEGFWVRFWVLRASFWNDSGTIVGSILKRVEVDFQTCWGQSSLLSLLVKFDVRSVPGAAARMFSKPSPGSSQKDPRKTTRETHETFQLQTPGERAQRASKGCTRPTTLAILMLAMLSPRWLRGASWCFALVLLAVLCASLLVFSVAVEACGLAPEQGYRLVLRLACFLSLPRDRARKFRKQARETHETLQLQTPGQRAQHVFAAFPGIEPESSEPKRSRNSHDTTQHDTTQHDKARQDKTRPDVFAAFPWIEPESSEQKRSKLTKRSRSKRPASARSARERAARDPPHSQS